MREKLGWLGLTLISLALLGMTAVFLGVANAKLDSSTITTFSGWDSSVYSGSTYLLTVGGLFIVAFGFIFLIYSMRDVLGEYLNLI